MFSSANSSSSFIQFEQGNREPRKEMPDNGDDDNGDDDDDDVDDATTTTTYNDKISDREEDGDIIMQ